MLGSVALRRGWRRVVHNLVPWLSAAFLVAVIVLPLGLFAWLFFFTDVFTVQAVTVVDAREHTQKKARQIVEEQLEAMPLGQNVFFVQTHLIEAAVLNELPQVRTVHVQRKLPGTIKTIIQEKVPAVLLLSNGQYYFVDAGGIPYEEARLETLPGVVLPTIKNDDSEAKVTLGVPVVAPEFVTFLQTIQDKLPELIGSEVAETRIPSLSAREVQVVLSTNWDIKFDVTRSAERQLEIMDQLLTSIISEEEKAGLEYIDLRVPNRIYYKSSVVSDSE